ncbi:MAG: YbaB/EbfC family nucleoid-associated protein [Microthrixaceae bacterium]
MSENDETTGSGGEVVVPDDVQGGPAAMDDLGAALGGGMGFDLGSMMEMAQGMQQQMADAQEQLAQTEVVGRAGGGVVTVTLNGHLHLRGVHIDPGAVDADDPSMLEDLVLAAWQDAHDQVAQLQAQADPLAGLGGMGGLGGLLGGA